MEGERLGAAQSPPESQDGGARVFVWQAAAPGRAPLYTRVSEMRRRPPEWIFAVALCYCAYFIFLAWCAFTGPEDAGLLASFADGRMRVERVEPGSPAARAGVLAGDIIRRAGHHSLHTRFDWMAATANWQAGRPEILRIERGGAASDTKLLPARRNRSGWATSGAIVAIALWSVRLATLVLALAIALRQSRYAAARIGAWFLATASVTSAVTLSGMAATWRGLPPLGTALLWPAALSTVCLPAIFFTFCAVFPRELFARRWVLAIAWLPAVFHLGLFGRYLDQVIYGAPDAGSALPAWSLASFSAVSIAYLAGGLLAIRTNYGRLEQAAERRRLQLLAIGAVAGWLAAVPLIVLDWTGRASTFAPALGSRAAVAAAAVFLACLFALAYALLRRRVFGIGLLIRQGLRYALARGVLVSAPLVAAAVLAADLLVHSDQPLGSVLQTRGWIYAALAAAALVARSRRQRWLDALDRRYFRERYDAQRLLQGLLEELRRAAEFEKVAPRVVALIDAALHPEVTALLVRDPGAAVFRTLAAAPSGDTLPPLPAESKVVGLVRVLGNPLEIPHSTGWIDQQLPLEETLLLRRARLELLVPVAASAARAEALIALGPKRSDEPYSADDRQLLAAVAGALGLLLERAEYLPTAGVAETHSFEECPECGACYSAGAAHCTKEGALLRARPVPRVLAGRYRLDRRLGRGGMGTVYEASDLALERAVAAKLIHEELAANTEAAERFRREARAAAGFSHPHIVTVHDFGVTPLRQAFLIMELLEGNNLRDELRRLSRLQPGRVLEILRGVTDAVDTAHRRRLIHRDLKPENIFLARGETGEIPKVLDFGVAKSLHALSSVTASARGTLDTSTGVLIGTLQYMSPEQLRGESPDPRWDIWALAVVAYEMLAGAYPFGAQWHDAVLHGRFTPLPERRWQSFFERALNASAAARPDSASRLFAELENALE